MSISSRTMREVRRLPQLVKPPLEWVMENGLARQGDDLMWLEFGVWQGTTINYISRFTEQTVYGFDSFEGLPEAWRPGFGAGHFNRNGNLPAVNPNVELVTGWFNQTLAPFLAATERQIAFVHLDADLYSSTAYVLDAIRGQLCEDAVLVFDEFINYEGFDGDNGELRAWDEFISRNRVRYDWIGGHGGFGNHQTRYEKAAVVIHDVR